MAAPDAQVTHDHSHGVMVLLPLEPTRSEHQRAARARRRTIATTAAITLPPAIAMAWTTHNAWLVAIILAVATATGTILCHTRAACTPRYRWVCHTARDLPGLNELIGPDPDGFLAAMKTLGSPYNTRSLAQSIDQLATYRDEWVSTLGSYFMADRLRQDVIDHWKPVRDAAETNITNTTRDTASPRSISG